VVVVGVNAGVVVGKIPVVVVDSSPTVVVDSSPTVVVETPVVVVDGGVVGVGGWKHATMATFKFRGALKKVI
jgi:hypothetical protein